MSKYPLDSCTFLHTSPEYANSKAQNIVFKCGNSKFSFTNVHLPCDSVSEKEKQIIAIDEFIHNQKKR